MTSFPRVSWLPGLATVLSILACYGTTLVLVLLSLLGISIAANEHVWAGTISAFAVLAGIGIAASYPWHRSVWPTTIAASGVALILWAMYGSYSRVTELAGFVLLVAATLLDWHGRRSAGTATEGVSWIEPDDLGSRLDSDVGPIVIDVRGQDEFAGPLGHIPDARNVPVGELPDRTRELHGLKNQRIVLVCRSDRRSAAASAVLRERGFQNVQVLRGGMERWNRENRAIASRPLRSDAEE